MPTYTRKVAPSPNDSYSEVEKVFKVYHWCCCIEEKAKEMRKGTMRDTIDGPRAMVIHLWYTPRMCLSEVGAICREDFSSPSTNLAMMCPRWLERFTLSAPSRGPHRGKWVAWSRVRWTPGLWYPSRISQACLGIGDANATNQRVEDDCLFPLQWMGFNMLEENLRSVGKEGDQDDHAE